jgi:hypothetical protein
MNAGLKAIAGGHLPTSRPAESGEKSRRGMTAAALMRLRALHRNIADARFDRAGSDARCRGGI